MLLRTAMSDFKATGRRTPEYISSVFTLTRNKTHFWGRAFLIRHFQGTFSAAVIVRVDSITILISRKVVIM
jgi:hypothetical protein